MTENTTVHAASDLETSVADLGTRDPRPVTHGAIVADVRDRKRPAFAWEDVPAGYSRPTETIEQNQD